MYIFKITRLKLTNHFVEMHNSGCLWVNGSATLIPWYVVHGQHPVAIVYLCTD